MTKTKRPAPKQRAAPEGPTGRHQVVIKLDQQVLYLALAAIGLILALVAGILVGQAFFAPSPAVPAASRPPQANPQAAQEQPGIVVATRVPSASAAESDIDPNLQGYLPADPSLPVGDVPRITISDLDDKGTFDWGDIPADQVVQHTFKLSNTGNADLVITQVYTSCGCTIPALAGRELGENGEVNPPLVIPPGESHDLTVSYDPKVLQDEGPIVKYVQIFSNDPAGTQGEVRFRLIGNVVK